MGRKEPGSTVVKPLHLLRLVGALDDFMLDGDDRAYHKPRVDITGYGDAVGISNREPPLVDLRDLSPVDFELMVVLYKLPRIRMSSAPFGSPSILDQ